MRARALMAVVILGVALFAVPVTPASAGGSCFSPARNGSGTNVKLSANCFGPTVLFVRPGTAVTWTNADSYEHTVTGLGFRWGSGEPLQGGQSVTYRFDRAGVYPYECVIHYGMVGTVVVGKPSVAAATAADAPSEITSSPAAEAVPQPQAAPVAKRVAAESVRSDGWRATALVGWGLFGLTVVALAVMGARRRRPSPTSVE